METPMFLSRLPGPARLPWSVVSFQLQSQQQLVKSFSSCITLTLTSASLLRLEGPL